MRFGLWHGFSWVARLCSCEFSQRSCGTANWDAKVGNAQCPRWKDRQCFLQTAPICNEARVRICGYPIVGGLQVVARARPTIPGAWPRAHWKSSHRLRGTPAGRRIAIEQTLPQGWRRQDNSAKWLNRRDCQRRPSSTVTHNALALRA